MEQKQEQKSPDCKHCGCTEVVKNGFDYQGEKTQRYLCKECGKTFTIESATPP